MEKFKKYVLWVFGGLSAILAILIGLSYERRKISRLKDQVEISRLERNVVRAETKKEIALEREKSLERIDSASGDKIDAIEKKLREVEKFTQEATSAQISDGFNSRYRSGQ